MNRTWRRALLALAITASLTMGVMAVRASNHSHRFHLKGWVSTEMARFDQGAQRYLGRSAKEAHQAMPQLDMSLMLVPVGERQARATGEGKIRIGQESYSFTLGPNQQVDIVEHSEGKIYSGGLVMNVNTREGLVASTMVLMYQPATRQSMVNIALGQIGQEVLIGFGEAFMSKEEMQQLGKPRR